jgi:hypothetical protein
VRSKERRGPSVLHPKVLPKRNKLPDATDDDVVSTFTYDTTNKALVHELGWGRLKMAAGLFDIATKFADGEDAVGAIFRQGKSSCDAGEPSGERRDRWEHLDICR